MTLKFTFLIIALITTTHANDWSIPCTSGSCGYVFSGDGSTTASGSMMLSGPNQVLSDITPAAGWKIIDCNPNWNNGTQNIRMVCTGTPQQMSQCNHLYSNGGAENTVVRLPQSCGTGPFARVKSTYVPSDQSMPPNISMANSTSPNVKGLTLDYNFAAIPTSRGKLSLALQSATNQTAPLTRRDIAYLLKRGRARPVERGFHFNPAGALKTVADGAKSAGNAVTSAGGAVTSAAGDVTSAAVSVATAATSAVVSVATAATSAVASVATSVASEVTSAAVSAATVVATAAVNGANEIKNATTLNEAQNSGPIPVDVKSSFPMFNGQINCGPSVPPALLKLLVDANVTVQLEFGYTFVGSLVPPDIHDFSLTASVSGDMAATYHIQAQSQGTFDTGNLVLFKQGLPGLNVPGIVTLGPQFTINGQLTMDTSIDVDMTVTTGFAYNQLQMAFPPNSAKSVGSAQPQNNTNAIKLSTSPAPQSVNGTITGRLTPRIDFGIIIGGGISQATVFLNSDITGVVDLSFQASDSAAVTQPALGSNSTSDGSAGTSTDPSSAPADPSSVDPSTNLNSTDPSTISSADPSTVSSVDPAVLASSVPSNGSVVSPVVAAVDPAVATSSAPPAVTSAPPIAIGTLISRNMFPAVKRGAVSVNGCVNVNGAINITGGMTGTLPPLFNAGQTFPIFSTSGQLFNKCFVHGAPAAPAPAVTQRSVLGGSLAARASRFAQIERRKAAPAPRVLTSSLVKRKNEVTPEVSKASTSLLSCLPPSLSPLNKLQSLI